MTKQTFLFILFLSKILFAAHIELYQSPQDRTELGRIYRWVIFHHRATDGLAGTVRVGECDFLDANCRSTSETIRIRREMPYQDYLGRLAEHFSIDFRLLEDDERAVRTFRRAEIDLWAIADGNEASDSEKTLVRSRLEALTAIRDRFNQALAIKRLLEAGNDIRVSHHNARAVEALRPFDAVADLTGFIPLGPAPWPGRNGGR